MTEKHVRWRLLADLRDGVLSPLREAAARAHLATGCAACGAESRDVARLVAAIAEGPLERPPAREELAAVRLFRDVHAAFARDAERLLGELVFDRTEELLGSLRAAPGQTRRLLWRVGAYDVDACVVARPGGADVLAQVVGPTDDPVEGVVEARAGRRVRGRAALAADGRFTFRGLARGLYAFEGRVGRTRFVLPPVRIED